MILHIILSVNGLCSSFEVIYFELEIRIDLETCTGPDLLYEVTNEDFFTKWKKMEIKIRLVNFLFRFLITLQKFISVSGL